MTAIALIKGAKAAIVSNIVNINAPNRSYQITLRAKAAGSVTVAVEESNDGENWFHVDESPKTVTCPAPTGQDTYGINSALFPDINRARNFMRASVTAISGTDADVLVMAAVM